MKITVERRSWWPWVESVIARERIRGLPLQNTLFRLCLTILDSDRLASFAEHDVLLWPGCTSGNDLDHPANRQKDSGLKVGGPIGLDDDLRKKLRKELSAVGIDSFAQHPHRPEFFAFKVAGRPFHSGAEGRWKFHHLYTGQVPFPARKKTLDARKHGYHFTQTAGMTCLHPIVDELLPHHPCLLYALRARSYLSYGYDPDHYFCCSGHDKFGFVLMPVMRPKRILDHEKFTRCPKLPWRHRLRTVKPPTNVPALEPKARRRSGTRRRRRAGR